MELPPTEQEPCDSVTIYWVSERSVPAKYQDPTTHEAAVEEVLNETEM
jgi:hypothetical protein